MDIRDLKEIVDQTLDGNPDSKFKVCIPNNKSGFGGTSVTYIEYANIGFDWDSGKFILEPENKMIEASDEDISIQEKYKELCGEIDRLQEKYDENGYDFPPTIKLQRIIEHII